MGEIIINVFQTYYKLLKMFDVPKLFYSIIKKKCQDFMIAKF